MDDYLSQSEHERDSQPMLTNVEDNTDAVNRAKARAVSPTNQPRVDNTANRNGNGENVEGAHSAKYRKLTQIATNEYGQARKLNLCSCKARQTKTLHVTWATFFVCFFVWFCTTNIYDKISADIGISLNQHLLAGALAVTSPLLWRLMIGNFCFIWGSRVSYNIILITTGCTLIGCGLVKAQWLYISGHLILGIAGASFVVTQYHTTRMFANNIAGLAQAMTAGFGNFGGGCANFIMPVLVNYFGLSWRWCMAVLALICFVFCFIYFLATTDCPPAPSEEGPDEVERPYCGPPDRQIGISFKDAFKDYRTWILFMCYAASLGVELTFYLVAAPYLQQEHHISEITSGLIVMLWSSMNLFARPLGGFVSDALALEKRVQMLFVTLFMESVFLIIFGFAGHYVSPWAAVPISLLYSICIQMAKGVVFNLTPVIQPKCVEHVIAIVGSGGNFGAAFWIFAIFLPCRTAPNFDEQYTWIIVGVIVMIVSFVALAIKFSEREVHDFEETCVSTFGLDNMQSGRKFGLKGQCK
eukprot:549293_1